MISENWELGFVEISVSVTSFSKMMNSNTKIEYTNNIQPENRAEIEKYLNRLLWLLPGWLHILRVKLYMAGEESGELACIRTMYDYREATLEIYCAWLDESPEDKLKHLTLELLHIHLNLIADYARQKLDELCTAEEAPKFNKALRDELTMRTESATQDLAKVITERLLTERVGIKNGFVAKEVQSLPR